jgi:hypothetical protein
MWTLAEYAQKSPTAVLEDAQSLEVSAAYNPDSTSQLVVQRKDRQAKLGGPPVAAEGRQSLQDYTDPEARTVPRERGR